MHPRLLAKTRAEILELMIEARALVDRGRPDGPRRSASLSELQRAGATAELVSALVGMMGWVVAMEASPQQGRPPRRKLPTLHVRPDNLVVSGGHTADHAVADLGLRARTLHARLARLEGELAAPDAH